MWTALVALAPLAAASWWVRPGKWRQVLLLAASYAFYAVFGVSSLAVLLASSLLNFGCGAFIRARPIAGRLWLGIAANVSLLGFFKYLPPAAAAFEAPLAVELARVALPIGMSFWTFQALSYLFDQYREEDLRPSLLEFCLYMGFGPTVLSGPICRLPDMLPQFQHRPPFSWSAAGAAARRIWLGLFMTSLARILGGGIRGGHGLDFGFAQPAFALHASGVWILAIGYGFQLFFDFAGYTHLAIGAAQLVGFQPPENFNRPYLSTSPSVFWTRWHMSLSFWIRDYVFLPLASARRGIFWRNFSLLSSMVIFGLWHKATAPFIAWGAYNGALLVLHRQWQAAAIRFSWDPPPAFWEPFSWVVTFFSICAGWILFRAASLKQAGEMLTRLVRPADYALPVLPAELTLLVLSLALAYFALDSLRLLAGRLSWSSGGPVELKAACYAVMTYVIFFNGVKPQGFAYFQF